MPANKSFSHQEMAASFFLANRCGHLARANNVPAVLQQNIRFAKIWAP
jgi:hypothetical protein